MTERAINRSPCGTGTSARLAHLHAKGRLRPWTNHERAPAGFPRPLRLDTHGADGRGGGQETPTITPERRVIVPVPGRLWPILGERVGVGRHRRRHRDT